MAMELPMCACGPCKISVAGGPIIARYDIMQNEVSHAGSPLVMRDAQIKCLSLREQHIWCTLYNSTFEPYPPRYGYYMSLGIGLFFYVAFVRSMRIFRP